MEQPKSKTTDELWAKQSLTTDELWAAPEVEAKPEDPNWYDPIVDVETGVRNFAQNAKEAVSNVTAEEVGEHLYENKFAYTLGTVGAFGGPWTSAALSAVGSGADAAVSDDESKSIVGEAAFSIGVDAAMLAAFKIPPAVTRKIAAYLKTMKDPNALKQATEDVFESLSKDATSDIGTQESVLKSQQIMEAAGGSLTLGQAGKKGLVETIESFTFNGILSKGVHQANLNKITNYAKDRMNNLFNVDQGFLGAAEMGDVLMKNLKAGNDALATTHGKSLDQVAKEFGRVSTDVSIVGSSLSKWRKSKDLEGGFNDKNEYITASSLDTTTQNILKELEEKWGSISTGTPQTLIDFTKDLNTRINSISNFGTATFSPQGVRELTSLSNYMRGAVKSRLKDINPSAAAKYAEAQKYYAYNKNALFPDINDEFIKTVDIKGLYKLGDMVTSMSKVENVTKLYKSIDTAFKVATDAKGPRRFPSGIKSPEDVKNLIRNRYLENTFPSSKNLQELDVDEFVNVARLKFANSDEIAFGKAVLGGEKFNRMKTIVNALATAAKTPGSNFGSLAMRSKEISAGSAIPELLGTAIVGGGAVAAAPAIALGGLTVLLSPLSLAHIVSDPKRVNQFLGLTKSKLDKTKFAKNASVLLNNVVADLYAKGMSKEEVEEGLGLTNAE